MRSKNRVMKKKDGEAKSKTPKIRAVKDEGLVAALEDDSGPAAR